MTPLVSVVIPCYNHGHYLAQALCTVLAQDLKDWEAIVVNDGSTDDTVDVVAQFSDPRIAYVYQENQGLSAARNTGIRAAQGKYLAFLDADDEWEPAFLQRCTQTLEAHTTLGGVFTRNYFIDERGTVLPQIGGQAISRDAFRSRNLEGGFFTPGAIVVRAALVCDAGLFDTQLTSEEDWDLWMRISERAHMEGLYDILARYRVYPGSMSTNAGRMHANRMMVLGKYFGPPDGDPSAWSEEKSRAFGFAYRSTCIGYMQQRQPDVGWQFLAQAVAWWPDLLRRLDTFYELACGDKLWGYRGQVGQINIESNGAEMLRRLDALFADVEPRLRSMRRVAYGNGYLALAILSDQAGFWKSARRYLLQAISANPRLLISYSVVRRLLKLCAGRGIVNFARRWLPNGRQPDHDKLAAR